MYARDQVYIGIKIDKLCSPTALQLQMDSHSNLNRTLDPSTLNALPFQVILDLDPESIVSDEDDKLQAVTKASPSRSSRKTETITFAMDGSKFKLACCDGQAKLCISILSSGGCYTTVRAPVSLCLSRVSIIAV